MPNILQPVTENSLARWTFPFQWELFPHYLPICAEKQPSNSFTATEGWTLDCDIDLCILNSPCSLAGEIRCIMTLMLLIVMLAVGHHLHPCPVEERDIADCRTRRYISEIWLKIKYRSNISAHNLFCGCPVILKFCTEHYINIAVFYKNFQNDWIIDMGFMEQWVWHLKRIPYRISYIVNGHRLLGDTEVV